MILKPGRSLWVIWAVGHRCQYDRDISQSTNCLELRYFAKWQLANTKIEKKKQQHRNGFKTNQKPSRDDNEQLKYDLTVLVSSKFIFNLREPIFLASAWTSAERFSKISANTLSVHVAKHNAYFLSLHKLKTKSRTRMNLPCLEDVVFLSAS